MEWKKSTSAAQRFEGKQSEYDLVKTESTLHLLDRFQWSKDMMLSGEHRLYKRDGVTLLSLAALCGSKSTSK